MIAGKLGGSGGLARRLLTSAHMTLVSSHGSFLSTRLGAFVVALASSACVGDPNVSFEELPATIAGGSGGVGTSGASGSAGASQPGEGGSQAEGGRATSAGGSGSAGAGGSAGSAAGSAGAGGSGGFVATSEGGAGGDGSVAPTFDLIDDVEGKFPLLPERSGRNGAWYMIHDFSYGQASSGAFQQLNPEAPESLYAARVSGSGFTDWGAQLGVTLKAGATGYDASNYCGVRFMAKGTGPHFTLMISDRHSVPQAGVCGTEGKEACYRFVGKGFEVSADWQEVQMGFSELSHQLDPQNPRTLDKSAIYDILFNFYSPEGSAFELLVDDLSFIEKSEGGCLF